MFGNFATTQIITNKDKFFFFKITLTKIIPSRRKTSSRHLKFVLELSCLDKTFLRCVKTSQPRLLVLFSFETS